MSCNWRLIYSLEDQRTRDHHKLLWEYTIVAWASSRLCTIKFQDLYCSNEELLWPTGRRHHIWRRWCSVAPQSPYANASLGRDLNNHQSHQWCCVPSQGGAQESVMKVCWRRSTNLVYSHTILRHPRQRDWRRIRKWQPAWTKKLRENQTTTKYSPKKRRRKISKSGVPYLGTRYLLRGGSVMNNC